MNRLLFGDNLKWLRDTEIFPDACVDLGEEIEMDRHFCHTGRRNA